MDRHVPCYIQHSNVTKANSYKTTRSLKTKKLYQNIQRSLEEIETISTSMDIEKQKVRKYKNEINSIT